MRKFLPLVLLLVCGLVIGCGGTDGSTGALATTTSSTSGTSGTSGTTGTTGSPVATGSYSGNFSGGDNKNVSYVGTGTGTISANGAATFSYAAFTTGAASISVNRSFTGTVSSNGSFVGTTLEPAYGGTGPQESLTATGTVTAVSGTQVNVVITWDLPYANGGIYSINTEHWVLNLQ